MIFLWGKKISMNSGLSLSTYKAAGFKVPGKFKRKFPWYICFKCPTYRTNSNVCKYHFFPLIFKKSDTLLFSINLFHPGSNFCFVLFLPAESNSGFIQAENEQLEFYLEKETWQKLSSIKWLITTLGCIPAPVCRSIKIWMDKEP